MFIGLSNGPFLVLGAALTVLPVGSPRALAASDSDLTALGSLGMARDVDDRCKILSKGERAHLNETLEYGISHSNLTPQQEKMAREHNPGNDAIACDSTFVKQIFESLQK